ncbi:MAG: hypothetical protein J6Y91_03220 [Alphaproteobacteria bacterium]|nr:hypothetical protein [Alphaproteobacteria bacterium]
MKNSWIIGAFFIIVMLSIVVSGAYFYVYGGARDKVYATANDIQFIAQNIHNAFLGKKYKDLDTDYVVYKNFLPFSTEPVQTSLGYQINNRFGGKMYFYEAFGKIEERSEYFALYNEPQKYQETYQGTSAYIILLTNLSKKECVLLSRVSWRRFIPNFLGMEISVARPDFPFNGVYNLKHYLLMDNLGEHYNTKDEGILARRPLSEEDADVSCGCRWKNCMVALKFL